MIELNVLASVSLLAGFTSYSALSNSDFHKKNGLFAPYSIKNQFVWQKKCFYKKWFISLYT